MEKKTKPMGVLEKTRIVRRKPNPCFFMVIVSYPKAVNMRGGSQRFV
jgi:hypothetical protein